MGFYGRRMIPEPLLRELMKKRYTHIVKCNVDNIQFTIVIQNDNKKDLEASDIIKFVESLPVGKTYPVTPGEISLYGGTFMGIYYIPYGVYYYSGTAYLQMNGINNALDDSKIYISPSSASISSLTITSQYVL